VIGPLVALISLDLTTQLVAVGIIASTIAISGATATTPIVVQTSQPHQIIGRVHGVVDQVGGMPEADSTWELTPIDATHLSLATYTPAGAPSPSVGTNIYTGGGRIRIAFPEGRILLGRRHRARHGAPPRIVFVPQGAPTYPLRPYGGVVAPIALAPPRLSAMTAEQQEMLQLRQIATEPHRFIVSTWAAQNPPDPDFGDFDLTQAIRNQLLVSMDTLCTGRWTVVSGQWTSQKLDAPQFEGRGQLYEMVLQIDQPVTAIPLSFVPSGTHATITVAPIGASPSDVITINTPGAPP